MDSISKYIYTYTEKGRKINERIKLLRRHRGFPKKAQRMESGRGKPHQS
jgi:hypothetical protein